MIGIINKDSSFFTVESPDVSLKDRDFSKNLMSLNIKEEMSSLTQGTLTFYDFDDYFSRVLRIGVRLNISWGYRNYNVIPDSVIESQYNIDEISGDLIRRGYQGFISNPSGSGNSSGVKTYNCNFSAYGFRGEEYSHRYENGTKKTVVSEAFDNLGISATKRLIDFTLGNDKVTFDKYVRQDETTFAFLSKKALEWGAIFHVAFTPAGETVGFFVDKNKMGTKILPKWTLGAGGDSHILGYNGEINNVISYKFTQSGSESGAGDNVRLDIKDGQIIFRRYVAEQKSIITYRLDYEKVQKEFNDVDSTQQQQLIKFQEFMSTKTFAEIKHFFTPVEQQTAPSGYGYRINCEMIGNPLFIPGTIIKINNGFPDFLCDDESIWYLNSVNHRIDSSGYNMSIEVIDVFNLSPIGLPVL